MSTDQLDTASGPRVAPFAVAVVDLPEAHSTNRSYGYFPPPPSGRDAVLYVGGDADGLRPHFADVRQVGDIGDDLDIYLLTGP